jgi:hypothetical protein
MEIIFQTKEESLRQKREAFLSLSKSERFMPFVQLMELSSRFPTKSKKENHAFKIIIESLINRKYL